MFCSICFGAYYQHWTDVEQYYRSAAHLIRRK